MRSFIINFRTVVLCACFIAPGIARAAPPHSQPAPEPQWQTPEPGLDYAEFVPPIASTAGNSRITVIRIDPARFQIGLYSVKALNLPERLPISGWLAGQKLVAAINGGMFEPDGTTTGYARVGSQVVNSTWKADYGAVLALDPDDPSLPAATILDPECDDVKALEKHYRVVLQSMRMVDCKRANLWKASSRMWSMAALGIDDAGRVLLIAARSPWDVHDFIDNVLALPIGLTRAMYLEGGPEVSLAVDAGGLSLTRLGGRNNDFHEDASNAKPWALPNVIGVTRKGIAGRHD